jgi:hypothetical protein
MSLELFFWILMILWVLGFGYGWNTAPQPWPSRVPSVIFFLIIFVLGWKVFGAPLHG